MSAIFWTSSVSKCSLRSFSRARGTISLSANSRAVSRIEPLLVCQLEVDHGPGPYTRAMDEFSVFVLGALVVAGAIFFAIGKYYPGSGAEQVDWRPTRSPELEAELELDDVDQMLEAQNERRRASGRPEITEAGRSGLGGRGRALARELRERPRGEGDD